MNNVGSRWRSQLEEKTERIRQEAQARTLGEQQARADEAISKIPGLIEQAIRLAHDSVRIYGWISASDVSGTSENRVDELWNKSSTQALEESDLSGTALIILRWCKLNDLECFITPEKIPMNDYEYGLYVRPTKT